MNDWGDGNPGCLTSHMYTLESARAFSGQACPCTPGLGPSRLYSFLKFLGDLGSDQRQ